MSNWSFCGTDSWQSWCLKIHVDQDVNQRTLFFSGEFQMAWSSSCSAWYIGFIALSRWCHWGDTQRSGHCRLNVPEGVELWKRWKQVSGLGNTRIGYVIVDNASGLCWWILWQRRLSTLRRITQCRLPAVTTRRTMIVRWNIVKALLTWAVCSNSRRGHPVRAPGSKDKYNDCSLEYCQSFVDFFGNCLCKMML